MPLMMPSARNSTRALVSARVSNLTATGKPPLASACQTSPKPPPRLLRILPEAKLILAT
jgi:hypothetical protein